VTLALVLQTSGDRGDRLGLGHPVKRAGVHQPAVARGGDPGLRRIRQPGVHHDPYVQPVSTGEVQVALVVRGHRHDRPGAVVGQHVVGGPDRDQLAVDRVDRVPAQEDAGLLAFGGLPLDVGQLPDLLHVSAELGQAVRGADLLGQRRVGRHHEERGPVQRVGPGGEHGDRLVAAFDREADLGTLGAADPVALHQQDPVRPAVLELLGVLEQPVGVFGDLEVPLVQHPAHHVGPAALALSGDDLLVGQHGLVDRAPVHVPVPAVSQVALVEPQEQPLVPVVVGGIAGLQPAAPVERGRVAPERGRLGLDVGVGPVGWMRVVPDGGVLGGQPEGVPADRVQDIPAAQEVVAGERVTDGVRLGVAHMQVTRRVRKHVHQVEPFPRVSGIGAGAERL
jgi:hypothetical protein